MKWKLKHTDGLEMKETEYIQEVVEECIGNMKHVQACMTNLDLFQSVIPVYFVLVTGERKILVPNMFHPDNGQYSLWKLTTNLTLLIVFPKVLGYPSKAVSCEYSSISSQRTQHSVDFWGILTELITPVCWEVFPFPRRVCSQGPILSVEDNFLLKAIVCNTEFKLSNSKLVTAWNSYTKSQGISQSTSKWILGQWQFN